MAFTIMNLQPEVADSAGKQLLGRQQLRRQALEIDHSGHAGNGHKRQQGGNNQKKQVIAGIHGGKSQQKRHGNIQRAGLGDFQTKGSVMPAISSRSASPLSAVS